MSSNGMSTGSNLFKFPQPRVCQTGKTRLLLEMGSIVLTYWPHRLRWSEAVITGVELSGSESAGEAEEQQRW